MIFEFGLTCSVYHCVINIIVDNTVQRKKSCLSEFFSAKCFVVTEKNFHLVGGTGNIAFPPLNYDQKVEFWPFLAFLACCIQHCSHSRASALTQLALLESFDPFYAGGSIRKPLWGPGGTIQEHL